TEVELGSQFPLDWQPDASAVGILDVDPVNGVLSKAIVPPSSPLGVSAKLHNIPAVTATIPVVAKDGLPEVDLSAPAPVSPGTDLLLSATASDDVGLSEVRFLMNDAVIGTRSAPPYDLTIAITEQSLNQHFTFRAQAVDTAGQLGVSSDKVVEVVPVSAP